MDYQPAYERQALEVSRILAHRESQSSHVGTLFLVEHPPVITVSRRPGARDHLIATQAMLDREGVTIEETDRGGDITYHGPGQLVVYPILDLNRLNLRLHDYMRKLEEAVIETCRVFDVPARRETGATGVWVYSPGDETAPARKVCAMGVRVRQWISMHGLALNVTTNLRHFQLIVPCGLVGRPVTSLAAELQHKTPTMDRVKDKLCEQLIRQFLG